MPDSIRARILAGLVARMGAVKPANGFQTDIGARVYTARASVEPKDCPCIVIMPGMDEQSPGVLEALRPSWSISISGIVPQRRDAKTPELVEAVLADLIEAATAPECVLTFQAGELALAVGNVIASGEFSATVVGVDVITGSWTSGDAAGTLRLRRRSGVVGLGDMVTFAIVGAPACCEAIDLVEESAGDIIAPGMIESINYRGGGLESYPDSGDSVAGARCEIEITYKMARGNPYAVE